MSIKQWFIDEIFVTFGVPARLKRLLAQHPEICASVVDGRCSIAHSSVARWDKFGSDTRSVYQRRPAGRLLGWRHTGPYYGSFELERDYLTQLSERTIIEGWVCDISDVHGFSASKSKLEDFMSMDAMVESNSREMIDEISQSKLKKNLAHDEIRIIHDKSRTSDHFQLYDWDKRLFLMNSGGSHHFAAAKYIAARLGQKVPLQGKLYRDRLNAVAVRAMNAEFEIFALNDDAPLSNEFSAAMRQFRATWLWSFLPVPYTHDMRAIFLPKSEKQSRRVARELRQAGAFDVGAHLQALCAGQLNEFPTTSTTVFAAADLTRLAEVYGDEAMQIFGNANIRVAASPSINKA
jgi:hypothetical protein